MAGTDDFGRLTVEVESGAPSEVPVHKIIVPDGSLRIIEPGVAGLDYFPASLGYANYVLEWDGTYQSLDFGQFWTPGSGTDYGMFATEFWCMGLPTGDNQYLLSDGYGGIHAQLLGMSGLDGAGRFTPILQVYNGSGATYCFGDTGPAPGEPCHMMYSYDSIHLMIHYDGVPVGKVAFAGPRNTGSVGSGSGHLLIGGSDHLNSKGWISQVRMWENNTNPYAFNNGITYLPAPVSPLRHVFTGEFDPTLLAHMIRPSAVVPDLAGDRVGLIRGTHQGYFDGPFTFPYPQFVVDLDNPIAFTETAPIQPTGIIDTPPATPAGALIFDSFSRRNVTFAFPVYNTPAHPGTYSYNLNIGSTEAGSLGAKTWNKGLPGGGDSYFGILNGHAVMLINAAGVAWVATGYSSAMSVQSDRQNGTYGSGVDTSVAFRVQDSSNFWYCFTHTNGTLCNVGYYSAGVHTAVVTNQAMPGGWTTLRVNTDPSSGSIKVYADNTLVGSPLTNATLKTQQGMGMYCDAAGRCLAYRWDNFTVFALVPDTRITVAGDTRVTTGGDTRILA